MLQGAPSSILSPHFTPASAVLCHQLLPLLDRGKDFATTPAPSHHGASPTGPSPRVYSQQCLFTNKVLSFPASHSGTQGTGGQRSPWGCSIPRGAGPVCTSISGRIRLSGAGPECLWPWEGRTRHGKGAGGSSSQLPRGVGASPLSWGDFAWKRQRFPWSNVSVGDREQRGELGGGRGLTSWGSWRGWRCRRRCSCCVPGARSPCCPTPRPSYGQKRQSLSHGGEPNPVEPSSPGAPRYLFLMIQCLVPFCVP